MSRAAGFSKSISGFHPRSITGCQLWLDAADSSSVTGTTTVTAWRDKSGNARNLSVGSGTTSYASNAITLASSYMVVTNAVDLTNFTFFIVSKSNGAIYNQTVFGARPNTSAVYNSTDGFGFYMDNQTAIRLYGTTVSGSTLVSFVAGTSVANVFSFQSGSTIINGWLNGTSKTAANSLGSRTSTAQGFAIGGEWQGSTYGNIISTASINEIIVYNTTLTASQRQQVEGYLAWKWGIQTKSTRNLIVGHSFYYIKPFTRIFQPYDIGSPFLWFDAADRRTIVGTSSVTAWLNKGSWSGSATSYSGTVVSGSTQYNGLNVVVFPTNGELRFTAAIPLQPRAWFAVFKQTTQVTVSGPNFTQYFAIINQTQGGSQDSAFGPGVPTTQGTSTYVLSEGPSGVQGNVQTANIVPDGYNVMKQYGWINSAVSTASNYQTVNGRDYIAGQSPTANVTASGSGNYRTDSVTYSINTGWYNNSCHCAEILMFNTEITISQRQQIEGYLANKWGLQTSLVSGHPYIKLPPSSPIPFLPTNFSGCALWLDAADPAGTGVTPADGTGISTWVDKSGSANSATAFTSINAIATPTNPTLVTRSLNGLPGLSFTATSGMKCPAFLTSSSGTVFMVVNFTSSSVTSFLVWKLRYSSYFAIAPGQVYVGVNNSGTYPAAGYDARATYTNSYGTPFVLGMTLSALSSASSSYTFVGSVNGTTTTTTGTSTSGNPSSCSDFVGIGVQVENGTAYYPMSGIVYEVIVYNNALSTEQRQKVEGYLACKWGLRSSLISTHPYKLYEPSQEGFLIVSAPGTPTGLTASNTTSTFNMSWTTGSGGTPVTFTVTVYGGVTLVSTQTISYPTTSTTFSPMTSAVAYTFYVSATNTTGTSAIAGPSSPSVTYTAPATVLITTVGAGSNVFGAGGTTLVIECWGGGGGSMGNDSSTGAGAGGAYAITTVTGLSSGGFTLYYSVGAGGTGGQSSASAGGSTWGRVATNAQPTSVTDGALAVGGSGSGVAGPNNSTQSANSVGQTKYIGGNGGYSGPENGGGGSASSLGNGNAGASGQGTAGGASGTGGGAGGAGGGGSFSGQDGFSNAEGGGGAGGSYNNAGGNGGAPGGAGGMGWSARNTPVTGVNTNTRGFGGDGGRGQLRYARS